MWQEETKTRRKHKKTKHHRHRSRSKPRKSHSRKRRCRPSSGSRSFLGFAWALFAMFYLSKRDIDKKNAIMISHPTNPHYHSSTKALGQKIAEGAGRRIAAPQEVILFCQQSRYNYCKCEKVNTKLSKNPPTRVGVTSILILCRVQNV